MQEITENLKDQLNFIRRNDIRKVIINDVRKNTGDLKTNPINMFQQKV